MTDIEDGNPADTFTFVDKRRVADTPEAAAHAEEELNAEHLDLGDESAPENLDEPQSSIYDIAAYCTGLLITEGFQRLGLLADPRTGKAVMDLPSARVAIDCVAALVNVLDEQGSTLPEPVRREMKRTLNDLRLNYVDRNRA